MEGILVLGAFGYTNNQLDGQTIKTRNVFNLLVNKYRGTVKKADTIELRRKPWLLFSFLFNLITCRTIIIIPAENSLTVLLPFLYYLSKLFFFNVICICIGGWQIEYFNGTLLGKPHHFQMKLCRKLKAFLPELEIVNHNLISLYGFQNTEVFPNFRKFSDLRSKENLSGELKIVFMARIQKKKGYPALFALADYIRRQGMSATITFYGQISPEDKNDFMDFLHAYRDKVTYQGALKPDDIQNTLKNYDVLVLPTTYYTEGFPGSVLDAYIAGIPVLVTEWKHSHEFVDEGITGFIIPFNDGQEQLNEKIRILNDNRTLLKKMKANAKKESKKYSEDTAWSILSKYLS